ncbi:zinc finger BED domain-containing protein 4 [Danaus plexippus plexippus]|uniref:Zinc finger BED domain-containing protein 4 n=1 Tax=Danaus plexippus plexippus TaxID=278856 RepID=A0A212F8U5_DANPL|nr:zinc finger BED domain-containing protein 4 [Danaus plexippus plexippus]
MTHVLNLVADGVLKEIKEFSALTDQVKTIVTFFKQSVNSMDQLRAEQESSGKKEGEVLTLIQAVSTRWNSCFDMLERFVKLSALVAKILATKSQTSKNTPDIVPSSQLNVIRDFIALLGPFKETTEEISGANYETSSLAIPLTTLVTQVTDQATPSTSLGLIVKGFTQLSCQMLYPKLVLRFVQNIAVEDNVLRINILIKQHQNKLVGPLSATSEVPSSGCVPNELKQYLDQPLLDRKSDPIKFWIKCRHFTPVLSDIALKYMICQASSVSSERVASVVNLAVPNERSRLTGDHIKQRVLLICVFALKFRIFFGAYAIGSWDSRGGAVVWPYGLAGECGPALWSLDSGLAGVWVGEGPEDPHPWARAPSRNLCEGAGVPVSVCRSSCSPVL